MSFGLAQAVEDDEKVAFGEYLSGECFTCHQKSGANKGIPSIIGLNSETFVSIMRAYRSRLIDSKVMMTIASALSEEEIQALAAYFATIKPVSTGEPGRN